MSFNYNTNYTKEQIEAILNTIKKCVKDNHYTIAQNEKRQENIDLITMKKNRLIFMQSSISLM